MSPERPWNLAASVRQRLLNRARERSEDFNHLLTRYANERLLFRLAESAHRDEFVLKGATLFELWHDAVYRATRDVDLLGFGEPAVERVQAVFRELCAVDVEPDGLRFLEGSVRAERIRDAQEYGGVRVRLTADLDGARIALQVDIGFGDIVTPGVVEAEFPTLLDFPAPRLRTYPRETVVAEKFEAVVRLGIANTRMKDFYDLWAMATTFAFDWGVARGGAGRHFPPPRHFVASRAAGRAAPGVHRRHREAGAMVGLLAARRTLSRRDPRVRHRAAQPLSAATGLHGGPWRASNKTGPQEGTGGPTEGPQRRWWRPGVLEGDCRPHVPVRIPGAAAFPDGRPLASLRANAVLAPGAGPPFGPPGDRAA